MSSPRTLTFFGGAATATGSMILLEAAGARVLLDAGLFQGNVAQADEKNRDLPLDEFGSHGRQALIAIFRPAKFDRQVTALRKA